MKRQGHREKGVGGSHSGDKALGQTLYFCSLTGDCCPGLETLFPYLSLGIRLFSVAPLTALDLFNALYSVCQRRDDSEQDGVITNSGGTTHSLSCLSSPFSLFNKICHTNTKPSFIVFPCSCNNLSSSLLLITGGGDAAAHWKVSFQGGCQYLCSHLALVLMDL